jgi:hypothetical protein
MVQKETSEERKNEKKSFVFVVITVTTIFAIANIAHYFSTPLHYSCCQNSIDKTMSLRRLFSHHSHSGQHRSRGHHSESSEEFRRTFPNDNPDEHHTQHLPDPNESRDTILPFIASNIAAYSVDQQQYRTRRRSSVQILDKKCIQLLSNQLPSSSSTADNDPNIPTNTSEDVCEF